MPDPANLISAAFLAMALVVLAARLIPDLNGFLHHGKVAKVQQKTASSGLRNLIDRLSAIHVRKSWFAHFYLLFAALIIGQLLVVPSEKFTASKYRAIWAMFAFQAVRRSVESFCVTKFSPSSTMHFLHYFVGMAYYTMLSSTCLLGLSNGNSVEFQWNSKNVALVILFLAVSLSQTLHHVHLASLVKYNPPNFGMFQLVSNAHYTDEITIYFIATTFAFSNGSCIISADYALLCSWLFAVVNLSISALETLKFYRTRFDNYSVKYAIIPFVV